ncbi:putative RNA helicase [Cavenderia fasciculata]|uniref:RNA helicase n=1 Tax=Cavenderia fasciculata TaxID=261658 RepID=F4PQ61_CACFS|nr:putative RNA helicase [Cavenderia fasciculata]EGG22524.1 putative RNA helicase [Cavenderia fasciculata]|eukprot:XP_004360375.1 putative RNA helicase [Cavenderia fasciculata]
MDIKHHQNNDHKNNPSNDDSDITLVDNEEEDPQPSSLSSLSSTTTTTTTTTTTNTSSSTPQTNRNRTKDVMIEKDIGFSELNLPSVLVEALKSCGFEKPSPVQVQAIPIGVSGVDMVAQAKSGTGKTVVFGSIAIERVLRHCTQPTASTLSKKQLLDMDDDSYAEAVSGVPRRTLVLMLAPTREIAIQIASVVGEIAKHAGKRLHVEAFVGGNASTTQEDEIKLGGAQVVVGTPGRIRSLIEARRLRTDDIELFIMDEADKLLDAAFSKDFNWIFTSLPKKRQIAAFSATFPTALLNMVERYMSNPVHVQMCKGEEGVSLEGIKQYYQIIKDTNNTTNNTNNTSSTSIPISTIEYHTFRAKVNSLLILLEQVSFYQAVVFCNNRVRAEELCKLLCKEGWPTRYIAGSMEQIERMAVMKELQAFKLRILVSTDLISRGIDIERVNLVVNMEVPVAMDFETYFHRIGRTGRFGSYGVSITYVSGDREMQFISQLQSRFNSKIEERQENDEIPEHYYAYQLASEKESNQLEQLKAKQENNLKSIQEKQLKKLSNKSSQSKKPNSNSNRSRNQVDIDQEEEEEEDEILEDLEEEQEDDYDEQVNYDEDEEEGEEENGNEQQNFRYQPAYYYPPPRDDYHQYNYYSYQPPPPPPHIPQNQHVNQHPIPPHNHNQHIPHGIQQQQNLHQPVALPHHNHHHHHHQPPIPMMHEPNHPILNIPHPHHLEPHPVPPPPPPHIPHGIQQQQQQNLHQHPIPPPPPPPHPLLLTHPILNVPPHQHHHHHQPPPHPHLPVEYQNHHCNCSFCPSNVYTYNMNNDENNNNNNNNNNIYQHVNPSANSNSFNYLHNHNYYMYRS